MLRTSGFFWYNKAMKHISLKGSWVIKAPVGEVFKIVTDFSNMPKNFPTVAESLVITKKDGNKLEIDAKAKSFGTVFPVKMKTEIIIFLDIFLWIIFKLFNIFFS